jgi:putative ABC transport system permease protein
MRLYHVAWREIVRRKVRTVYTASGVTLAVALMVATIVIGIAGQRDILLTITRYGHSLTIFPATSHETSLRGFGIGSGHYIPENLLPQIIDVYEGAIRTGWAKKGTFFVKNDGMPGGIDAIEPAIFAPRLYEEAEIQGRKVVVAGVVPDAEYKTRFWWEVEAGRLVTRPDEVMLGKVFAAVTGIKAGDSLAVKGRPFKVAGILRDTDSPDDYMVFGLMKPIQEAFGKPGLVSMVNVRAMCNYCPVGEAEVELNKSVVGVRATSQQEIAKAQHAIFDNITRVILGFVVLTLIIACMAMFNMTMGSIHGRLREVGLFKVLGASPGQLVRLFMYEAGGIGLIGGVVGFALGVGTAFVLAPWLIPGVEITLHWWYLPIAGGVATVVSLIATIYPALFASRLKAAEAFRAL